jgi:rubredoxin
MRKYQCPACDYIYDPEIGDPDADIPAGTPFEELPEEWVCPDCGVTKSEFEPIEE